MRASRMFRGLRLICCVAGALLVKDASAQQNSTGSYCGDGICQNITCQAIGCPVAENGSNCSQDCNSGNSSAPNSAVAVCVPGFDLTCSPKIEVGTTKPSATKKGLVLKRDNLPFNQSDIEVIPFKLDPSGSCGENGVLCPTKSFDVGMSFTGLAASVTANVSSGLLARSSDVGSACGSIYLDLYAGRGKNARRVLSKLVGRSCDQQHQSLFKSIVLTDLKAGENYEIRGRFECAYSKIPQAPTGTGAGHFLCSTYGTEVTLVWPFGVKAK